MLKYRKIKNGLLFRRGGGKRRKTEYEWKGQNIEDVKEVKYLEHVVKKNVGQKEQIKKLKKKGNVTFNLHTSAE